MKSLSGSDLEQRAPGCGAPPFPKYHQRERRQRGFCDEMCVSEKEQGGSRLGFCQQCQEALLSPVHLLRRHLSPGLVPSNAALPAQQPLWKGPVVGHGWTAGKLQACSCLGGICVTPSVLGGARSPCVEHFTRECGCRRANCHLVETYMLCSSQEW